MRCRCSTAKHDMLLQEDFYTMRSRIDCVYCYLKQIVSAMEFAGIPNDKMHEIVYIVMDDVKTYDKNDTPAWNSTLAILRAYELMGIEDPYKEAKKDSNDLALAIYPDLRKMVDSSDPDDRLLTALKVSVSGNVIDLGISRSYDIHGGLRHSLEAGFARDDFKLFRQRLDDAEEVIILGDNAGEIVFDKLLVEELNAMGKKTFYAVKGGPILNDALMEDAIYTGMDKITTVITNGSNYLGNPLCKISEELLTRLKNATLVISKGQANFETLDEEDIAKGRIFFLLKTKCERVAEQVGIKNGGIVFFTP